MYAAFAVALVAGVATGLPYYHIPSIPIGPIDIQVFGMLVAAGVLIGAEIARRYALRRGVDEEILRSLTDWCVLCGFAGAHLFDVFVYELDELRTDPWRIVKVWQGISSYGGFLGATIGFLIFLRRHKGIWPALMADITLVGTVFGFTMGRVGCTIVHDHPGAPTDFVLGFDYPAKFIATLHTPGLQGDMRLHNLGFYELLYLIVVNLVVLPLAFRKKKLPAGMIAVITATMYAPVRFFLEFWRLDASDPRYGGLTAAQWMSILAFAVALYALQKILRTGTPAPYVEELGGQQGGYKPGVTAPPALGAGAGKPAAKPAGGKKSKKS